MKNLKNNKKGFTLIELLAVIVILAILVMVAIPAVTKYLDYSRRSTFADNVSRAVDACFTDYQAGRLIGGSGNVYTTQDLENSDLLSKPLKTNPWGGKYEAEITIDPDNNQPSGCVIAKASTGSTTYAIKIEGFNFSNKEVCSSGDAGCTPCTVTPTQPTT